MTRGRALVGIVFMTALAATRPASAQTLDYSTLSHQVRIDSFRAGHHDPSGMNQYYFTAVMRAAVSTPEEMKLPAEQRRSNTQDLGEFGALELASLSPWKAASPAVGEAADSGLPVQGDSIRQLVAKTMSDFNVREEQVEVTVLLTLFEKAKKFIFFGDDLQIATATYTPLPAASLATKVPADTTLSMSDDKGLAVTLKVEYAKRAEGSTPTAQGK